MSIGSFFKSVGRGLVKGLKATKAISTLAPVVGAAFGPKGAVVGQLAGKAAASQGFMKGGMVPAKPKAKKAMRKGGRVSKPKAMRKGGRVSK